MHEEKFIVDCEKNSNTISIRKISGKTIINALGTELIDKVNHSVYPVISHYSWKQLPPENNSSLKQQMLSALRLKTHT